MPLTLTITLTVRGKNRVGNEPEPAKNIQEMITFFQELSILANMYISVYHTVNLLYARKPQTSVT